MFSNNQPDGNGIILCQNGRWQAQRRFSLHIFRNFGVGKNIMEEKIMIQCDVLVKHIKQQLNNNQVPFFLNVQFRKFFQSQIFDLEHPLSLCVGNIIHELVIGRSFQYGDEKFIHFKNLIDSTLSQVASPQILLIDSYPFMRFLLPAYYRFENTNSISIRIFPDIDVMVFVCSGFFLTKLLNTSTSFGLLFYLHQLLSRKRINLNNDDMPTDYIDYYLREMAARKTKPGAADNEYFKYCLIICEWWKNIRRQNKQIYTVVVLKIFRDNFSKSIGTILNSAN
jgi:hypothetical protein